MGLELEDQVILVTGSAKGLGRFLAEKIEGVGATTFFHFRNSKSRPVRFSSESVCFDVRDKEAVQKGVASIVKKCGRLDALIQCVGPYHPKRIDELSDHEWKTDLETTLHGSFNLSQQVLPTMRKNRFGRIIYVGDSMADRLTTSPHSVAYKIAKNGLYSLARAFAQTEMKNGITVNVVSPGVMPNSVVKPSTKAMPRVRLTKFEEVYQAILFLLSKGASKVTGTNLVVSGGFFGV